ncbi:class I adenylate-forming enzyme family protein [Sphingomonas bisphenolicum]
MSDLGTVEDAALDRRDIRRMRIGDIIRRSARRFPDRICAIDGGRSTTFKEMDDASSRFANYLLDLNLPSGASVAVLCSNSIDHLECIFGIHKAGHVFVPINIVLGIEEIQYILEHAEAQCIIIDEFLLGTSALAALVAKADRPTILIGAQGSSSLRGGTVRFEDAIAGQSSEEPAGDHGDDDLAMIMYTSGTTSRAKGVMHGHRAVQSAASSNIAELSITRDDRVLIFLPMFHIAAHCLCMTFLAAGGSVVLQQGFDPGRALKAIGEDRSTFLVGLPMMYEAMLNHPDRPSTDLSSLRVCNYAMAPMARNLLERLIAEFCPTFLLTSGQTEAYPHTVIFRPEEQLRRSGNYWGQGTIVNDVAVMDDAGNILPQGEIGEIVYRGPNMMLGYFKDPDATREASMFGWHHSGDLGRFDEDNQLMFVDRKKDMIKSGGENIATIKVEEVLLRFPAVEAAAVFGVPHPRWQEAVFACVQLRSGLSATPEDLIRHCKQHLAGFEVPKVVEFVTQMPRTASSKLRKVELRQSYLNHFLDTNAL